jgi:polyisoprenoid-binding protein YceI
LRWKCAKAERRAAPTTGADFAPLTLEIPDMARPLLYPALTLALAILPCAACHAFSPRLSDMPAGVYAIDKTHASLTAKVIHMGFSAYTFRFTRLDGSFAFDPARPAASKLRVTVDPASIDTPTGNDDFGRKFNTTLAGDGWLETVKYPKATFVSTAIDIGDGHRGKVTGNLTLHGVTKPVILDVTFNGSGPAMPPSVYKSGFSAAAVIRRSDFGVAKLLPGVGDQVALVMEIEFARK